MQGGVHPWLDASPWKLIPFEGFFDFQVTWQFPSIKSHSQVERKTERIIKSTLLHDLPQGLS